MSRTEHHTSAYIEPITGEHKSKPIDYRKRRLAAGVGVILAGAAAFTAVQAGSRAIHNANEFLTFSEPHLADHLEHMKGFVPEEIITHKITAEDANNPTKLAEQLGALDVDTVASEIASQVGGERSMNPGETIVLPRDQLQQPVEPVVTTK